VDFGTYESWYERIDWALGNAGVVLKATTDDFLGGEANYKQIESATVLAEAWRDLAVSWGERISRGLEEEEDDDDDADTEDDEPG
jgi:hypothetical protein